jgi:hypothetical protein
LAAPILEAARAIAAEGKVPVLLDVAIRAGCSEASVRNWRDRLRAEGEWPWPNGNPGLRRRPARRPNRSARSPRAMIKVAESATPRVPTERQYAEGWAKTRARRVPDHDATGLAAAILERDRRRRGPLPCGPRSRREVYLLTRRWLDVAGPMVHGPGWEHPAGWG